jgi:hypothetical protein
MARFLADIIAKSSALSFRFFYSTSKTLPPIKIENFICFPFFFAFVNESESFSLCFVLFSSSLACFTILGQRYREGLYDEYRAMGEKFLPSKGGSEIVVFTSINSARELSF